MSQVMGIIVLKPLRRLWCNVTLQSRLVLELQLSTYWQEQQDCQSPRVQDTCWFKYSVKRREYTKRLDVRVLLEFPL